MGLKIPQNFNIVENSLGRIIHIFQISSIGQNADLYNHSIENFNRQLRKVTKSKAVFPNDDSLLNMLYLAQSDITRKWTGRRRDLGEIHSQLKIFFADRLDG